jgi:hypothetical protein
VGTAFWFAWGIIQSVVNQGISNFNSFSGVLEKRMSHGLQFQGSYILTRDLSDEGGVNPTLVRQSRE